MVDAADAVDAALGAHMSLAAVRGIGLSGHMHGATLLDADERGAAPLHVVERYASAVEAAELDAIPSFAAHRQHRVSGLYRAKVAWVREHEPEIFAKIAKVLLPKDYLRLWLTGEARGRDVRCRRHQLAGRRQARLVRRPAWPLA